MLLSEILEKINSISTQKGQKVAVAFSGGLDSLLAIPLLKHIYEAKEIISIKVLHLIKDGAPTQRKYEDFLVKFLLLVNKIS